jgi:hypothetical protein
MRYLKTVLLLTIPLGLLAVTTATNQSVPTTELQRYIYQAKYPIWCGNATMTANQMRAKPSTDPKFMHEVMKANIAECANTQFAQQNPAVWNTAVFAAAAAALIAARHEEPPQSIRDATHAKKWSKVLVNFVHQPGAAVPGPGNNIPSMYRTDAGRMHNDAVALLGSLQTASTGMGPPDSEPDPVVPAPAKTP